MRKLILGAAAAAMITGSSIAQAAPVARDAAPVSEADQLAGAGGTHLLLGALALGLLIFILIQINDQDGEDVSLPHSP